MKNLLTKLFPALIFLSIFVALPVAAMDMDHSSMDHGSTVHNEGHSGMSMGGDMIMLKDDIQGGVKASAHLRDISKTMEEMGMDKTHHFMVMFKENKNNKSIDSGLVAVKIIDPTGAKKEAIKLMGMDGSFGADVALNHKGVYSFEIGSKLSDGEKRKFNFKYTVM